MGGHVKWSRPKPASPEVLIRMIAYVEGYLLALDDLAKDIQEEHVDTRNIMGKIEESQRSALRHLLVLTQQLGDHAAKED